MALLVLCLWSGVQAAPPANDNFPGATISGASGTTTGTNVDATLETGEPDNPAGPDQGGRSVWYSWTAPTSDDYQFNTSGSNFDTTLGVYTGNAVNALTLIDGNDDGASNTLQSRVSFTAVAGTTYRIAIDGYDPAYFDSFGNFVLNWGLDHNDDFPGLPINGVFGSLNGSNTGATLESGEVPNTAGGASGGHSVWYSWTAPVSGHYTFSTDATTTFTLGIYTGTAVNALTPVAAASGMVEFDATAGTVYRIGIDSFSSGDTGSFRLEWAINNDDFPGLPIDGPNGYSLGNNTGATLEAGEVANTVDGATGGHSIWYSWTAPANGPVSFSTEGSDTDTTLGVYTGTTVNALTLIAANNDVNSSDTHSTVSFNAVAGTVYRIGVDGYSASDTGDIYIFWGPNNDAFPGLLINGSTGSIAGSNAAATLESGEVPNEVNGAEGGASVWYSWTAPSSGVFVFDTHGSDFDTTIGIYTGNAVNALTLLAANDDDGVESLVNTSGVAFHAVAGTTYRIGIDTYDITDTGGFLLNWEPGSIANDDFPGATITGATGSASGTNLIASLEPGEPVNTVDSALGGASVWYSWTAPATGIYTFRVDGDNFAPSVAIYTGSSYAAPLTKLAAHSDFIGANTIAAAVAATAGTTYRIQVDGYGPEYGDMGDFTLTWGAGSTVVTNTNDSGPGSLRDAVLIAGDITNSTVTFNIPAALGTDLDSDTIPDVWEIKPLSTIQGAGSNVVIDGTSQAAFIGGDPNPAGPEIVVSEALGFGEPAFILIGATNWTVRSLVVNDWGAAFFLVDGSSGNRIEGCYIGLDATGTTGVSNQLGIVIDESAGNSNVIGGTTAAARNIISGSSGVAINIASNGNIVRGNYIGTDATGTGDVANANGGIVISQGADNNTIGGTGPGEGNLLAYNAFFGVGVVSNNSDGNSIRGNSIYLSGHEGISLDGNASTPLNDAMDADTGPNNLQNYPVLSSTTSNGSTVTVSGTLNSTPNKSFAIDLYASLASDLPTPADRAGRTYLGAATVTTNGSGNATFTATLSAPGIIGQFITATATRTSASDGSGAAGDTSTFSVPSEVLEAYSISGYVRTSNLSPIAGVTVSGTGGLGTVTTDSSGFYRFDPVVPGLYTLTPTRSGFTFSPTAQGLRVSTANRGANFVGTADPPTFTLNGRISTSDGTAISGVTVTLSLTGGGTLPSGTGSPATTNSAGYYSFRNLPDGNYTITPAKATYNFTPPTKSLTINGANPAAQNFIGATGYSISGRLMRSNGSAIVGATVTTDTGQTATTNSAGYYTLRNVPTGERTLTPTLAGYTFAPLSKSVTVGAADQSGINFIGTGP